EEVGNDGRAPRLVPAPVQRLVVTGDGRVGDDVGFRDGPPGRAELLADLQVLEVSHPCRRSPGPGAASVPAPRWRHRPALDHELGLALLHGLAALVQDRPLDGDDPPVELRGLALVGDPETHLDGVPDLDRALEAPAETEKRDGGEGTR